MSRNRRSGRTAALVVILVGIVYFVSRSSGVVPTPNAPSAQPQPMAVNTTQLHLQERQETERQRRKERQQMMNHSTAASAHGKAVANPDTSDPTAKYWTDHDMGAAGARKAVAENDRLRVAYEKQQRQRAGEKGNLGKMAPGAPAIPLPSP